MFLSDDEKQWTHSKQHIWCIWIGFNFEFELDAFEIDLIELNIPHIHLENITDQIDDTLF